MLTNFQTKYKIQCKIGEGSFSEVLKCQNKESGQLFAAKRLKKSFQNASNAAEISEIIAMKKLPNHPNILQLIESHFEQSLGRVTLVFDLMDMSIYDMMKNRKRPLPESRVKNYLYQILKGVAHLHSHGVFHRDIKPENILIKGELIKVADLGSVRGIYSRKPYTEYISTRWYRSPECLLTSGYYGPKMDVWAIGCVFYELLTLKPLFPGSNELDQISKINMVIGTPNQALLSRFKKHKSQNTEIGFTQKPGTGFGPLLQNISEAGRDILKMMLIYDPKVRSATRRLLENRYFNDLRENDLLRRRVTSSASLASANEWRNPVLLSFMTSERKRKQRHKIVTQSKVPRPVPHTPLLKQKIPESVVQPLKPVVGMHKISSQRPVMNKTENSTKSKLIKRDVQKICPAFEKSLVLQETTNVLTAPLSSVANSHNSSQGTSNSSLMRINSTSASFLPSLAKKNEQINPLARNSISQRHIMSKSFLMSSNKPRLEPILEHITPRQYITRKLINNSQHFK